LDNAEVLNVRWATIDPNPAAQKREARKIEEQAADAIRKALPPEYVAELEGRDIDSRKKRKIEGSFGLDGYEAPDQVWHAKQKADWIAEQRGLSENSETWTHDADLPPLPKVVQEKTLEAAPLNDGFDIFAGSTLNALEKVKALISNSQANQAKAAKRSATSTAPLVGYASDSDDS